jgi:hypothetical protein
VRSASELQKRIAVEPVDRNGSVAKYISIVHYQGTDFSRCLADKPSRRRSSYDCNRKRDHTGLSISSEAVDNDAGLFDVVGSRFGSQRVDVGITTLMKAPMLCCVANDIPDSTRVPLRIRSLLPIS